MDRSIMSFAEIDKYVKFWRMEGVEEPSNLWDAPRVRKRRRGGRAGLGQPACGALCLPVSSSCFQLYNCMLL